MLKALFYKEWVKTNRIIALTGLMMLAITIYVFINTDQLFRMNGAVQVWSNIILKDMTVIPAVIQWFPPIAAILLAWSQFIPEMTDKRLKLTLHLPLPESNIILTMLLYGVCILVVLFLVMFGFLTLGMKHYFAAEIIKTISLRILPWFIGGIITYFFAAWVCLEPVWKQRVFNALCSIAALSLCYLSVKSGGYLPFIPYMLLIILIGFTFPFYSAARFKDGVQS